MIRLLRTRPTLTLIVLLAAALLLSIAVGSVFISPAAAAQLTAARLNGSALPVDLAPFNVILFDLRLPRTLLMALAGAGLAGSGAAYQGLFRNPLADPYLIGVASGAGLGAILAMTLGVGSSSPWLPLVPMSAFLGALVTVCGVAMLARVGGSIPSTNLVLAGVAVSSFATSMTSFLMLISTGELRRALVWLLGGASMSGWAPVVAALPYILIGLGVLLTCGHALNVMQFGDEQARQLGLPVGRVRLIVIAAASMATAAAVAFAGIIGFVGLIVPHVVRIVWGGDYRRILPFSFLGGAAFLLLADVLARVLLAPQELPVGILTAMAGAPFFLWVLRCARAQAFW